MALHLAQAANGALGTTLMWLFWALGIVVLVTVVFWFARRMRHW